jgi:hypothetical protein
MISYTITPVDSTNTANIESRLNQYHGDSNIVTNREDGRIVSWTLTSSNQDVASFFESIEGVQSVDTHSAPERTPRDEMAITDQPESHKRDVPRYVARATNDSDTKQTEAFLKSKVQEPDGILPLQWTGEGVMGWYNLLLDDKALAEVKSYEGIKHVYLTKTMEDQRYLPSEDQSRLQSKKRKSLGKDAELERRADK